MVFYPTMLSEHKQVHPTSILAWQWRTCRFAKNNLPSLRVPHAIYLMYIMYVSAYKYCQFLFSCSIWRCTILVCYPVVTCIFNLFSHLRGVLTNSETDTTCNLIAVILGVKSLQLMWFSVVNGNDTKSEEYKSFIY